MALGLGYGLPFSVKRPVQGFSEDVALSVNNALADAAQREEAGNCLAARAIDIMQTVQTQPSLLIVPQLYKAGVLYDQLPTTRTNFIPNNSMSGATGSVLPTNWSLLTLPSGITVSYSASGTTVAADGTSVNYIDVTVSGTAAASGFFLNVRPTPSPSTIPAFVGQSWNTSVYLQLISGSVSALSPSWQLQELNSSNTFLQGSNVLLSSLVVGGPFERYNVSRVFTDSTTAFVTCRWGHSLVSGTAYSYTIRIGSPQLERLSVPTPMIATSTGAVTRLNESTNVVGLPPEFSVSRNTTATRVNSSGLIASVASGVPRIDWLGQSCPALLVEPASTNFAPNANLMNVLDTPTASGGVTFTTGSTDFLAPDGASGSINKYVGGTASGATQNTRYAGTAISVTAAGQHTFSLFVKAGATNPLNFCALSFGLYSGGSGTATSFFSLASGTAITAGASIQDYGNGWYRLISAPYTIASGDLQGTVSFNLAASSGSTSFAASGALGLTAYTWGAQVEAGSVATTYIPTTSGTGSRAADVISASGALVSGLIGQTEGTLYAEVDLRNWIASGRILTCSNGTSDERLMIQVGANRTLQAIVTTASADVVDISTASGQVNGVYKCALTYASGDFAFYVNGTQIGTDSSGGVPASTSVFLGKIGTSASTNFLNDRIRAAALYTTRLSNAQLAELTRL